MAKADYIYEIKGPCLCITDMDKGNMSVTNDLENVVREVREELNDLGFGMPPLCIYMDSEGMWDGIEFMQDRLTIYPLQKEDMEEAIDVAKMRYVGQSKGVML